MKRIANLMLPLIAMLACFAFSAPAEAQQRRGKKPDVFKFLAEKYDANKDGKLSQEEYDRSEENFKRFDTNKDGELTADDWSSGNSGRRKRGGRGKNQGTSGPTVGDAAPDFMLTHIKDKEKQVQLSSFAGSKPVALIFGSCT